MSATATAPTGTSTPPPKSTGARPWKWTLEQYREFCDRGFFDHGRVEFVFGEIIDMGKQGWPHALALELLVAVLRGVFASGHWVREEKPFPVVGSQPQPDAAVIPGSPRDYSDHPTTAVLIVEVSDTTLKYDVTTKAELYATAGVADYWVLDVENRQLHVFRDPQPLTASLEATAYQTHLTLSPTDRVSPLAAPSASILVSELLP
jgi:Uma2 family endonuclease